MMDSPVIEVYACGCVTVRGPVLPPNVVAGTLAQAGLSVAANPGGVTANHYPCAAERDHDHHAGPAARAGYRAAVDERWSPPPTLARRAGS